VSRGLALLLGVSVACSPVSQAEEPAPAPTDIGASEALREDERALARGFAGPALAQMPEADLTTEEGQEVLSFSATSVMALSTFMMILGGVAETADPCYDIERAEQDGTERVEVRADDCAGTQPADGRRYDGMLVLEERETECGKWASLTLQSWTIKDDRTCGESGAPRGRRVYEGRIVSDECRDTIDVDLVLGGEGLEELDGECRPVRRTALRYRLSRSGGDAQNAPIGGEGEVGVTGAGRARVETIEQRVISDDCRTEAVSGLTRARADGRVLEVRYDGATECTDPGRAPLFLDGQRAGTTEHACAAGGSGPAPLLPLILLLAFGRRRRP